MIGKLRSRKSAKDESGSSIVQLIMVMFPVLILSIAVVEFAIFNYETAALSSQISRVLVTTDVRDLAQRADNGESMEHLGDVFAERIRKGSPAFTEDMAEDDFQVKDFNIVTNSIVRKQTNPNADPSIRLNEMTDANSSITIECVIVYKMPSLYAYSVFDQNRTITRPVKLVQTGSSRFEVSQ